MGSTKPYLHPHPVAEIFCFQRCTQQHQHQPAARAPCADIKKNPNRNRSFEWKNGPLAICCFFWSCDSEILFLQPKPSKKKRGSNSIQWGNHFLNPQWHLHPGRIRVFFAMLTWWKQALLGPVDQWYESWSPKPTQWILGFHENIWIFSLSFHKPERKGYGVAGQ